jgi:ferredoxin
VIGQITSDARKCAGCLICQMVCSFQLEGEFNPSKAQISIIYGDDTTPCDIVFKEGCILCGECETYCPRNAIIIK